MLLGLSNQVESCDSEFSLQTSYKLSQYDSQTIMDEELFLFACLPIAVGITFDLNRGNCPLQCQEITQLTILLAHKGLCLFFKYCISIPSTVFQRRSITHQLKKESISVFLSILCIVCTSIVNIGSVKRNTYLCHCQNDHYASNKCLRLFCSLPYFCGWSWVIISIIIRFDRRIQLHNNQSESLLYCVTFKLFRSNHTDNRFLTTFVLRRQLQLFSSGERNTPCLHASSCNPGYP